MIMIIVELEYLEFHLGSQMEQAKAVLILTNIYCLLLSSNYRKDRSSSDVERTRI